jgi:hypothetical protein
VGEFGDQFFSRSAVLSVDTVFKLSAKTRENSTLFRNLIVMYFSSTGQPTSTRCLCCVYYRISIVPAVLLRANSTNAYKWSTPFFYRGLVTDLQKISSPGLEPKEDFRVYFLCSHNLPDEANNFGLRAVLLSCLVSELKKPSSPGLVPGTDFWGCGPCSCVIPDETNNYGLFSYHS